MRRVAAIAVLLACTAASPSPPGNATSTTVLTLPEKADTVCRDRIEQVRTERGLPKLQRETAQPEEPYFIAAVDKRVDGCSVMVMRNNTIDIRPLPKFDPKAPLVQPAQ
ncbi:hypothetical protein GRI89_08955 [Altererythrobacter salegens]|uniref:Lipoprotein n=1 Tax=Croceibacterium salegens TaxID=1737568 RepID=A0A6I4SXA2_9SPHN|nr:hypothetical protein [Croceibacterium salegens]MXO59667.1 hypothetical protein [Croceibacterium salegens]